MDEQKENRKNNELDAARYELRQSTIDDQSDEQYSVGAIIHRTNTLVDLLNRKAVMKKGVNPQAIDSISASISREAENVSLMLDAHIELKIKHTKNQQAILKRYKKSLSRYAS